MEQLKESFKHDFSLAVKSFNEKDYKSFFRNIRPAMELLGQLSIYDILGESDAVDLLEGDTSIEWKRDAKIYKISQYPSHHKPAGREFCELVPQVFYSKNTDVTTTRIDEKKKRLKRGLDSCAGALSRYYSIASEFGSHSGSTDMDVKVQAIGCASFLIGYFDFMKSNKVLSSSTMTFLCGLDAFQYEDPSVAKESKLRIEELIAEIEKIDTALLTAQKLQVEAEQQRFKAEQRTTEVETQLETLQNRIIELQEHLSNRTNEKDVIRQQQITEILQKEKHFIKGEIRKIEEKHVALAQKAEEKPAPKKRFGMKQKILKAFDVEKESMDDEQLDLIDDTIDKSMIVAGCAGSGKSVIAMYKAQQILDSKGDVILIAYTKSLNRYMRQGKDNNLEGRFFYHWQWVDQGMPKADYIIVDEIQDFDKEEIMQFKNAAKKCFFFFGDTAQSIYTAFGKQTMTIEQISSMTGITVSRLYNNYRLPKPIAKITQEYLGLTEGNGVRKYSESLYLSKESALPIFIECDSKLAQIKCITSIINDNKYQNVGILVPENEMILEIMNAFTAAKFACEFKCNAGYNESKNKDTLDFKTERPKLMTYHSAKGLQFETVILPYYKGAKNIDERKSFYVAMTRAYRNLYVLYNGVLKEPLSGVPERLYERRSYLLY